MAQIWLDSVAQTNSKDEEVEYQRGQMPTFKYRRRRTYLVIADNLDEDEDDILANANVPALGDTETLGHPIKNRGAKDISVVIHPVTGVKTNLWEVEVSSDSTLSFAFAGGTTTPPLELPPKYKWETGEREVNFNYDAITGEPVQNVNGEPIFGSKKITYPILAITRYESYFQDFPTKQLTYARTLNNVAFGPFPKGVCWMAPIECEEDEIDITDEVGEEGEGTVTVTFLKVTYRIHCLVNDYYAGDTSSPWTRWELNQGYYVRPAAGQPPVLNIWDGNKTLVNLELDGTAVPEGGEAVFLPFNEFKYADWTSLALSPFPVEP